MAWDDAPPTANELKSAQPSGSSWDSAPPTANELKTADLARKVGSNSDAEIIGSGNSGIAGLASGATFGFDDEIGGALGAAGRAVGIRNLGGRHISDISFDKPTLDPEELKAAYLHDRNSLRQAKADAMDQHPLANIGGNIVGGIMNPAASPIAKYATKLGGAGAAAMGGGALAKFGSGVAAASATGAGLGGVQGLGDSDSDEYGKMATDALHGAELGAAVGGTIHAAVPIVTGGLQATARATGLADKVGDFARNRGIRAMGPKLKEVRTMISKGNADEISQFALDNGLISAGDTSASIAEKAKAMQAQAGAKIGSILDEAGDLFSGASQKVGFDPVAHKAKILQAVSQEMGESPNRNQVINKVSNYLDELAENHKTPLSPGQIQFQNDSDAFKSKQAQYLKARAAYHESLGQAGAEASQPALPGMIDDLQRPQAVSRSIELNGRDPNTMSAFNSEQPSLFDHSADAEDAQQAFGRSNQAEIRGSEAVPRSYTQVKMPAMEQMRGQTSMPFEPQAPVPPTMPNDPGNALDPRVTNRIKGALDEQINYARDPLNRQPDNERGWQAARRIVNEQLQAGIEAHGSPRLKEAIRGANKQFGLSAQIGDIAQKSADRDLANKTIGLSDKISGATGATIGTMLAGPMGTAPGYMAGVGFNKAARTFGNAAASDYANRVSKFLMQQPRMAQLSTENPRAFQAAVLDMTQKFTHGPSPVNFPAAAENERNRSEESGAPTSQYNAQPESPESSQQKFISGN